MSEDMNLSINGQSQVPPGFRFHPTEEELLHYYLRKKVGFEKIDLDVIREVDLNKLEPWDIQEKCKIGSTPQNDWYFFSHKDKKYPTGTRTNRATAAGFWKATGRDKIIYSGFRRIGLRKTLVFYKGRAPHGQKSDWIMHEYRLDESPTNDSMVSNPLSTDSGVEDGWVVCRVFKKKNYQKSIDSPKALSISNLDSHSPNLLHHHLQNIPGARNDGILDQILLYMGRTCKLENDQIHNIKNNSSNIMSHHHHDHHNHHHDDHDLHERFMHLPRLESPTLHPINPTTNSSPFKPNHHLHGYSSMDDFLLETDPRNDETPPNYNKPSNDWVALERLVASQLNGQDTNIATSSFCSPSPDVDYDVAVVQLSPYNSYLRSGTGKQNHHVVYEADLWSSSPSSSDPLCHLSV